MAEPPRAKVSAAERRAREDAIADIREHEPQLLAELEEKGDVSAMSADALWRAFREKHHTLATGTDTGAHPSDFQRGYARVLVTTPVSHKEGIDAAEYDAKKRQYHAEHRRWSKRDYNVWISEMNALTQPTQRHKQDARNKYGVAWSDEHEAWRKFTDKEVQDGSIFSPDS